MPNEVPPPEDLQRIAQALGLNLRTRDNLLQLVIVLVCAGIGAAVFYFTDIADDLVGSANTTLGGVIGAALGLIVSGAVIALTRGQS